MGLSIEMSTKQGQCQGGRFIACAFHHDILSKAVFRKRCSEDWMLSRLFNLLYEVVSI